MTTIATGTVVTALFHHEFHYAYTPDEVEGLVRMIVDEPPHQPVHVYVWDRPALPFDAEGGPAFPSGRLHVSSHPGEGWGALNYMNPGAPDGRLVDSANPNARADTPPLLFDPEGQLYFPASASLPLGQVRDAVAEYCRTGQRPTGIHWQLGYWY